MSNLEHALTRVTLRLCLRVRARVSPAKPTMALPWLLVLELVLYGTCFICGIIAAALLTVTQGEFAGKCMLYGTVTYNKTTQSLGLATSSPSSLCYFLLVISVCVAVYCFSLTLYWIYSSCMEQEVRRNRLWMNVTLMVCGVYLFFLLVSGCVLKVGRDHLCDSIIKMATLKSCVEAQNKTWVSPVSGKQFYNNLHSAETSVWVNFFFWILILAVVIAQRRQGSAVRAGGEQGSGSSSETEPILNRPSRPQ